MDLESWRPEDNARRIALILAGIAGAFVLVALWLAASLHFFLAVLGGAVAGVVVHFLAYPLLLAVFRR